MRRLIPFLSLLFCLSSCWKDDLDTSIVGLDLTSDWNVPAIRATLDLKDIDEELSFIETRSDGRMDFVLSEDSVISHEASEYFDLPPDQPLTDGVAVRALGAVTLDFNFSVFGGAGLNQMTLYTGDLVYNFPQSYPAGTLIEFTINNATLNGQPAIFEFEVTQTSSSGRFNVDGLDFDFTTTSGSNRMSYTVELIAAPGLDINDPVEYEWNFENISVENIEGYFGRRVISLPPVSQPINFGGLERFEGLITLYAPEIRITINNPLGVGFNLTPAIAGIKSGQSPRIINLPLINVNPAQAPGVSSSSTIVFNENNSDITDLLQGIPEELFIQGTIVVNDDQDSTLINFANRNDLVTIDLELIIPLEFSAETITLRQQLRDISLFNSLPVDLNRLELGLRSENKFPFLAEIELFFLDENAVELDSVSLSILQPANVNENGRVLNPVNYTDDFLLDESILDILPITSFLEVRLRLATTANGSVPVVIYDDYTFETLLTFKAGLNSYEVKSNDNE